MFVQDHELLTSTDTLQEVVECRATPVRPGVSRSRGIIWCRYGSPQSPPRALQQVWANLEWDRLDPVMSTNYFALLSAL